MWSFMKGTFIGAMIGAVVGLLSSSRTRKRFRRSMPYRAMMHAWNRIEDMV